MVFYLFFVVFFYVHKTLSYSEMPFFGGKEKQTNIELSLLYFFSKMLPFLFSNELTVLIDFDHLSFGMYVRLSLMIVLPFYVFYLCIIILQFSFILYCNEYHPSP